MDINMLIGETLTKVEGCKGGELITFTTEDGRVYQLCHHQDCCESVYVDDICGDLADLVGSPIILAEESTSNTNPMGIPPREYEESFTWTFYRLATLKGYVTIKWYGTSNGYYSESVDFEEVK